MIDITRSPDAPASLAKNKRYNEEDVLEALFRDFLGKCYLCETKLGHHGVMEVDHRIPVNVDANKKFDWTNLYPACRPNFFNQRRVEHVPEGEWLNPGQGVETRVVQHLEEEPSARFLPYAKIRFVARNATDKPATNTAVELDRIHNATGSDKRSNAPVRANALRYAIAEHYGMIRDSLAELDRIASTDSVRADALKGELRKMFGRDAPYFMLMQSWFRQLPSAKEFLTTAT